MHQLILASQSPRRLELLKSLGIKTTVDIVKVSEIIDENLNLEAAIGKIAEDKGLALVRARKFPKGQGILVLSADTVVVLDNKVLGKPKDAVQASEFLRRLSGVEHRVISGISVYEIDSDKIWTRSDTTYIQFFPLTEQQITDYIATGEAFDKAGAYGIQGAAQTFVRERRGSWSNVVGLPLEIFEQMVKEHGWQLARDQRA